MTAITTLVTGRRYGRTVGGLVVVGAEVCVMAAVTIAGHAYGMIGTGAALQGAIGGMTIITTGTGRMNIADSDKR